MSFIPSWVYDQQQLFIFCVPLIHFYMVEWHIGDQVLRQFGCTQLILSPLFNIKNVHGLDKKRAGRGTINWAQFHASYIILWDDRYSRRPPLNVLKGGFSRAFHFRRLLYDGPESSCTGIVPMASKERPTFVSWPSSVIREHCFFPNPRSRARTWSIRFIIPCAQALISSFHEGYFRRRPRASTFAILRFILIPTGTPTARTYTNHRGYFFLSAFDHSILRKFQRLYIQLYHFSTYIDWVTEHRDTGGRTEQLWNALGKCTTSSTSKGPKLLHISAGDVTRITKILIFFL